MTQPPRLWWIPQRYLGLTDEAARRWWLALDGATWSVSVAWRAMLLDYARRPPEAKEPVAIDAYIRAEMPPRLLVQVLEALVAEGRLGRHPGSALEEQVFTRVLADGTWK
jgi:hypothetical protein